MADETIQNLNIDISVDDKASSQIKSLEESIDSLLKKFETLDTKTDSLSKNLGDFGGADKSIDNIATKLDKMTKSAEKFSKTDMGTKQIEGFSNAVKRAEQSAKLSQTFKNEPIDMGYLLSDKAKLDYLNQSLNQTIIRLRELAKTGAGYENPEVRNLISQINKLNSEISKTKNNTQQLGKESSKAFDKANKSAKKASKSTKKYGGGLKNILITAKQFLIFGAFFTIQRQISDAFSEGTQNLYQYSKAIDGKFAESMDRLSTSFLYLKNAIGAVVAPIINYFTPMLEGLVDSIAEFGNKFAEAIAALTGQNTFKKAVKSFKEYSEAADEATESTKNALASFDELNNISTSLGGTNANALDYGSMFVEQEVNLGKGLLASFIDNIKKGNWNEAGSILAQKVNGVINKINSSDIGNRIADKFNAALKFVNGFLKTFDFGNFAKTIFTQITNLINRIDFGEIGKLFSNLMLGALDFIDEFVNWITSTNTWETIFDAIVEFIKGINWEGVFYQATQSILNLFEKLAEFTIEPDTWAKLASALIDAIINAFKGAFKAVADWVKEKGAKEIIILWGKWVFKPLELFNDAIKGISKAIYEKISPNTSTGQKSIDYYANGGYPTSGQMFIARESGPELVGNISGRTAVVNNDQIVQAVSLGVYNAVVDAMSVSNNNSDEQPTIIQIDGREVFRAVRNQNNSFKRRTGASAF